MLDFLDNQSYPAQTVKNLTRIEWALLSHCFALALLKPASLACAAYLWAYSSNCAFTNLAHKHRRHSKLKRKREYYRTKTYKVFEESLPTSVTLMAAPLALSQSLQGRVAIRMVDLVDGVQAANVQPGRLQHLVEIQNINY